MITLRGINKDFRVAKRKSGFSNAIKALFSSEYEMIHALRTAQVSLHRELAIRPLSVRKDG